MMTSPEARFLFNITNTHLSSYNYTVHNLLPHTLITFTITSCSSFSCSLPSKLSTITTQTAPSGLLPPFLWFQNDVTTVYIEFFSPKNSNGDIIMAGLMRMREGHPNKIILNKTINNNNNNNNNNTFLTASSIVFNDSAIKEGVWYKYSSFYGTPAGVSYSPTTSILTPSTLPPISPRIISVSNISPTSFRIYYHHDPEFIFNLIISTNNILFTSIQLSSPSPQPTINNHTLTDLTPYTTYTSRLQACFDSGACSTGVPTLTSTHQALPQHLAPPHLENSGPNSVLIKWKPPAMKNGKLKWYIIQRRSTEGGEIEVTRVNEGSSLTSLDTNLKPFTLYEYQVEAVNQIGSVVSAYASIRTLQALSEKVQTAVVRMFGAFNVRMCWDEPGTLNGILMYYEIRVNKVLMGDSMQNSNFDHTNISNISTVFSRILFDQSSSRTCTQLSGLQPFTNFSIRVSACNMAGCKSGGWSKSFQTSQSTPEGVHPAKVEVLEGGSAVLLRFGDADHYNGVILYFKLAVEKVDDDKEKTAQIVYEGLKRLHLLEGLEAFTNYSVTLSACTIMGCTHSSPTNFRTSAGLPTIAPIPDSPIIFHSMIQIIWNIPADTNGDITSLQVFRKRVYLALERVEEVLKNSTDNVFEEVFRDYPSDHPTLFNYTDTNLQAYTVFHYFLRLNNQAGYIDSHSITATTLPQPPSHLSPPLFQNATSSSIFINLSYPLYPNGVIEKFILKRHSPYLIIDLPSHPPPSWLDDSLSPSTMYFYSNAACTSAGCTWSSSNSTKTLDAPPSFVHPPSLLSTTSHQIELSWKKTDESNGEIVEYKILNANNTACQGLQTRCLLTALQAFTTYQLSLVACTRGGCNASEVLLATTSEAPPQGMAAPLLIVQSATSILVQWASPSKANGIITLFQIKRNTTVIYAIPAVGNATESQLSSFLDSQVQPATTYLYTVSCFNSIGSVTSNASRVTMPISTPQGVRSPNFTAGSFSFQVFWQPPVQGNGPILKYNLYMKQEEKVPTEIYTGKGLNFTVGGLTSFQNYTFQLEACTEEGCGRSREVVVSTLSSPPKNLPNPTLHPISPHPQQHIINISWHPPVLPNGQITHYLLFRTSIKSNESVIYNGLKTTYSDTNLLPFTSYSYKIQAFNDKGNVSSGWEMVKTLQGVPQSLASPLIKRVTSRSVEVFQPPPTSPNGYITNYSAYINSTKVSSRNNSLNISSLEPATSYQLLIQVCNPAACLNGSAVMVTTLSAPPQHLSFLTITNITSSSFYVSWSPPLKPHGKKLSFQLSYIPTCPQPYSTDTLGRLVPFACTEGLETQVYRGTLEGIEVKGLEGYSSFMVVLRVGNEAGWGEERSSTSVTTLSRAPEYLIPPILNYKINILFLDWTQTFRPNAPITSFKLFKDNKVIYSGNMLTYADDASFNTASHTYHVSIVTQKGVATSPFLIFDPVTSNYIVVSNLPTTTIPPPLLHQQAWFLAVIVLASFIVIIFFVVILITWSPWCVEMRRDFMMGRLKSFEMKQTDQHHTPSTNKKPLNDMSHFNDLFSNIPIEQSDDEFFPIDGHVSEYDVKTSVSYVMKGVRDHKNKKEEKRKWKEDLTTKDEGFDDVEGSSIVYHISPRHHMSPYYGTSPYQPSPHHVPYHLRHHETSGDEKIGIPEISLQQGMRSDRLDDDGGSGDDDSYGSESDDSRKEDHLIHPIDVYLPHTNL